MITAYELSAEAAAPSTDLGPPDPDFEKYAMAIYDTLGHYTQSQNRVLLIFWSRGTGFQKRWRRAIQTAVLDPIPTPFMEILLYREYSWFGRWFSRDCREFLNMPACERRFLNELVRTTRRDAGTCAQFAWRRVPSIWSEWG